MSLRKILFWCHLTAGSIAGVVIFVMCVTGVLLAGQRCVIHWAERGFRAAPKQDAQRQPLESVLENAHASKSVMPSGAIWRNDPTEPVEVTFGRGQSLLLNPYTGATLGEGAVRTRAFFHSVEDWHRWLAVSLQRRAAGRGVTGACNLAFLFLVCSGPFLWWPRTWTAAALKAGTRFNGKLTGKARDFNWHNVIGFWCCIPLALIVACAVVMSYPWANNLVYRITGNPPPPSQANAQKPGAGPAEADARSRRHANSDAAPPWQGIDELAASAEQRVTDWRTITLRLPTSPSDPNLIFSIDSGNGGRPDKRAQLTIDRKTAREVRWEPFSSYNSGRRLRSWIRFTHTGEAGGPLGQFIAAIAALGGAFLVWTGISLAIRRLRAAVTRDRASAGESRSQAIGLRRQHPRQRRSNPTSCPGLIRLPEPFAD
ncbi:MAG TPA: PepSY-associated TM helix domain-containing protein [Candidatus Eisenbacteria bacterium]|jgi:uncharacterized iron-regulated membrane protein|nr:PepSY-associated TM helix domain-containing protein [Candidatus Eisenbacteria bacterium]